MEIKNDQLTWEYKLVMPDIIKHASQRLSVYIQALVVCVYMVWLVWKIRDGQVNNIIIANSSTMSPDWGE